jgi:anti-sigma-K factor RskA
MNGTPQHDLLAAEYVLGVLDAPAQAEAEHRLRRDTAFARDVESWRTRLSDLDRSAELVPPPATMWAGIERALQIPAAHAAVQESFFTRIWSDLAIWRGAAFAAVTAALLLAVGLGFAVREAQRTPAMVAVLVDGDRPGAVVHVFADGHAVLLPLTDIPVPSDRDLQVWTLPSRERGPVSIGLMQQARTLALTLSGLPVTRDAQLFEITLEPKGGSPIGRPTGPILYKGLTSRTL